MYDIQLTDFVSEEIIKKAIEMDHAAFRFSDWIMENDAKLIYQQRP